MHPKPNPGRNVPRLDEGESLLDDIKRVYGQGPSRVAAVILARSDLTDSERKRLLRVLRGIEEE